MRTPLILAALLAAAPALADPGPRLAPAPCPGNPAALGTARSLVVGTAAPVAVGLKSYPRSLALADHEVALTFDDGPSTRTTPAVLETLEHECVRATFFLIGRNAAVLPALVRREVADGDTVGHHSWSHPAVTERGLAEAAARADIERGFQADDRAAYGSAEGAPRVPFFRFPGFGDTPALLSWLDGRHVAVFGADLWASDWLPQTPEAELALVMERLDKVRRGIVLLHDIKPQTAAMLPAFLRALKAGGYRIVALEPGPGATALRAAPAGWSSETESAVEAVARRPAAPADGPQLVGLPSPAVPRTAKRRAPAAAPPDATPPADPPGLR